MRFRQSVRGLAFRSGSNRGFEAGLEQLEDRLVLAAVSWTGNAGDNLWHTAGNWSNNAVPTIADDVTIDVAANPTITFNTVTGTRSVASLVLRELLTITGGELLTATSATVGTGGTLRMNGGAIRGGTWDITTGAMTFGSTTSQVSGPISITGNPDMTGNGATRVSGAVTLAGTWNIADGQLGLTNGASISGGTWSIGRSSNGSTGTLGLVSNNGVHTGTIGAGTIVRGFGGLGQAVFLGGGTPNLVNQGTVTADEANRTLTVNPGSTLTNSGTMEATAGLLTLSPSTATNSASGQWQVSGGTLTIGGAWSNAGAINVTGGTLNLGGTFTTAGVGTLNRNGGTLNVTGAWDNSAGTFTLTPALGVWRLNGGSVTGGTLTINVADNFQVTSTSSRLFGPITVNGNVLFGSNGQLRVTGGLTLNGTMNVFDGAIGFDAGSSTAGNATFLLGNTVSSGGGIFGIVSAGSGVNSVTISSGTTVSGFGTIGQAVFVGGGTFEVINNGLVQATSATRTLTINPTAAYRNNGTTGAAGGIVSLSSTWTGTAGTLNVSSGTLNMGGTFTTADINLATFTRTGGTVNITGALDNTGATLALTASTGVFTLSNGSITGGAVTIAAGGGLTFNGSTNNRLSGPMLITGNPSADSNGTVRFTGEITLNGTFLIGSGTVGLTNGAVVNGGTYIMGDGAGSQGIMGITSTAEPNTVTINAGTTIRGYGTFGGWVFTAGTTGNLTNHGTIIAEGANRTLTIGTPSLFTNTGTLRTRTGATLAITSNAWTSSTGTFDVEGGTLNLGGTFTTADLNVATFIRSGGTVNITGILNNTTLALSSTTGAFRLLGGRIVGGVIDITIAAGLQFSGNTSNRLAGPMTINGSPSLDGNGAVRISGTMSLNGTFAVSDGSLGLENGAVLNGGTYTLGNASGSGAQFGLTGSGEPTVATIGAGTTVRGYGGLGLWTFVAGTTGNLVNNGTIIAEGNTRTLTVNVPSNFTTNGTMSTTTGAILTIATTNWSGAAGTFSVQGGTLNLGGAFPVAAINLATFTRTGGTVNITGAMDNVGGAMTLNAQTGIFRLNGGTLTGGTLNLNAGGGLEFTGNSSNRISGPITINGNPSMDGSGNVRLAGTVTLNGTFTVANGNVGLENGAVLASGTYSLGTGSSGGVLGLTSTAATTSATIGAAATVRGHGNLGQWTFVSGATGNLANNGTVIAEGNTRTLTINTPTLLTNTGVLSVTTGATLTLSTGWTNPSGSFSVQGGTLNLGASFTTASLRVGSFSRTGGTVNITGALDNSADTLTLNTQIGVLRLLGGTITGGAIVITVGGGLNFGQSSSNRLIGPMAITGSPVVDTGGNVRIANAITLNSPFLVPDGIVGFEDTALTVLGEWVLGGVATSGTLGVYGTGSSISTLTIGAGALVRGAGTVGNFALQSGTQANLVNNGTISATGAGRQISISTWGTLATFINNGVLESIANNSVMSLPNTTANFAAGVLTGGTWRMAGGGDFASAFGAITTNAATIVIEGANSAWPALDGLQVNNGVLTIGAGARRTITPGAPGFTNTGTINLRPDGILTVTGNIVFGLTSVLNVGVINPTAAGAGKIASNQFVTLNGTLNVSYEQGLVPERNQFWAVITGTAQVTGQFTVENVPNPPYPLLMLTLYEGNRFSLACSNISDLDRNGVSDFNDYLEFLNLFNANDLRVDFNGDGAIDFNDYLEFLNLYN